MTKPSAPGNDVFGRYLLGDLSDRERDELEEKYFDDPEVFEQLVEAEHDLVDSYDRGALTPEERKQFEQRFLGSESGAERVEFARALRNKIASRSTHRIGLAPFAVAASVILLILAAAWLVVSSRQESERLQTESRPVPVQQTTPPPTPPPPVLTETAVVTSLILTPGGTRDSDAATPLVVRPAPQWIQLELMVEQDRYDSYTASLQDVEGRELWKESSLQATKFRQGRKVALRVPARLLPPGDYVVMLRGLSRGKSEEIGTYTFNVVAMPAPRR